MKKFLLYIWQLPQNILGMALLVFYRKPVRKGVTFLHKYNHLCVFGEYWLSGFWLDQESYLYLEWLYIRSVCLGPLYLIYLFIRVVKGGLSCR